MSSSSSSSSRAKPFLKRSLLSYAIAVAAAGTFAQGAYAGGIDLCSGFSAVSINSSQPDQFCTVDVDEASLTVTAVGILREGVDVEVDNAAINNMGGIATSRALNHGYNSELYSLYFDDDANGTLTNSGNITAAISGAISGSGLTGSCSGSGSGSGSGSCYSLNTDGSVNALYISDALGGSVTNTEDGIISASAYGSANTSFPSDMNLSANAVYIGEGIDAEGSFDNQGTITATSEAYAYSYFYGYNGNGDENATANAVGVYVSDISGAFINGGDITATAMAASGTNYGDVYASAYAIGVTTDAINSYGSFANSGDITATSTADATTYGSNSEANAASVGVNIGYESSSSPSIASNNEGGIAGSFSNTGTIEANATATVSAFEYAYAYAYAQATGVNVGDIASTGTFTNDVYGSIAATATANATVNTYSEVYAFAYAEAIGVDIDDLYGSLINKGSISADAAAISTAYNSAYAFAYAYATGVQVEDVSGIFTNEGSISATGTVDASGYHAEYRDVTARTGVEGVNVDDIAYGAVWTNALGASISATATANATGYIGADVRAFADAEGVDFDDIDGTVSNMGTISAVAAATAAATNSDYGFAFAFADATGLDADDIGTYGSLTNSGAISALATATGTDISLEYGSSYIYADALGLDVNDIDGSVVNALYGSISATAIATADVYNNSHGRADASAHGVEVEDIDSYGSFTNAGHITAVATSTANANANVNEYAYAYVYASAVGVEIEYDVNGTFSNTGSIAATVTTTATADAYAYAYAEASAVGVEIEDEVSGTFSNTGSISATATSHVTANSYGDAQAYGYAVGVRADSIDGSMINAFGGVITASAITTVDANSYGEAHVNGQAYGVYAGNVDFGGSLTNKGQINATSALTATEADGYAYAYAGGTAYASGAVANLVRGSFTNDHSITASATGTTSGGDAHAYAHASGMTASALYGTMSNSQGATIVVSALSDRDSAVAKGMTVYSMMSVPTIDEAPVANLANAGAIIVSAKSVDSYGSVQDYAAAYGMFVGNTGYGSMIGNTGIISVQAMGDYAAAYGIYVGNLGSGSVIENTGTISVSTDGNGYGSAYGIYVNNGEGSVDNSGSMNAGVYLGNSGCDFAASACAAPGTVSLTNSGSITTVIGSDSYVSGDYTQTGAGSLSFEVDGFGKGSGGYARMDVDGNADFSANNKVMMAVSIENTLQDGDVLDDVITAGTFTTTALKLTDNSAFFDFSYVVDGLTIDLTANKVTATGAVAGSGLNLSESAAGFVDGLIEDAADGDDGDLGDSGAYADLADALFHATTPQQVAAVLESVGPILYGPQATRAVSDSANKALGNHIADVRSASSGDTFKDGAVWVKPFLGMAEQDAANGVSGYEVDSSGFLIGVDGAVSDAVRVGVAYAGANSDVDGGTGSKMDINTMQFVAYGSYAISSNMMLDLNVGWASNEYDQRRVAFGNGTALANYNGTQLTAGVELSYSYKISDKMTFIPSLAARFSKVETDGYTETGAVINNTVMDGDEDAVLTTAKGAFEWSVGSASTLLANVGVSSNSSDAASVTSLLSGSGATYVANGIEQDSSLINAGVGYRYVTSKSLAVTAAYDMESSSGFNASTVSVKLKMPF